MLFFFLFLFLKISTESFSLGQQQGKGAQSGDFSWTQYWRAPRQLGEKKEIEAVQIGKEEVKLSLFTDNMILYVKNSKDSTKKKKTPLELIKEFIKVAEYKITQKISHISTISSGQPEKKIKRTIILQ